MAGILCPLFPKMRFHLASTLLMLAVTWISLWLLLCHLIICYICVLVVKMLVEVNVPTKCRKMIWHPEFICIYIWHYSRILMCYLWCFLSNPIQSSTQFSDRNFLSHSCCACHYWILLSILVWFTKEEDVFYYFEIFYISQKFKLFLYLYVEYVDNLLDDGACESL